MRTLLAGLLSLFIFGCISATNLSHSYRTPNSDVQISTQQGLQELWAPINFSDPRQHEDKNFSYLVHASAQMEFYDKVLPGRKLSKLGRLSVSVINQNHIGTFRNAGVILSIPQDNFIAASDEDMGGCGEGAEIARLKDCFEERFKLFGLPSPSEILQRTIKKDPTSWNEILVAESPLASIDPEITGLFLRTDSFGNCLAEDKLCRKLEQVSARYNYPLIKIPPPQNEIWVTGYPEGGKIEKPFGYFVRHPPFNKVYVKMKKSDFKKLEAKSLAQRKNLYITSTEFIYGATPMGIVVDNNFFLITSKSDFGTIMRTNTSQNYTFSKKPTPVVFTQD